MPRPRPTLRLHLCLLALLPLAGGGLAAQEAPQPRHHAHSPNPKQQIAQMEDQWKAATLNGDAALMDKLLSDDYVGISWTGQVNTKQMQLDRTRTRTVVISKMDFSDVKIKLLGPSAASVTSRAEVEGTNEGTHIDGEFRYTRVYQRLPSGQWKITNFEATRIPPGDHRHPHQQPVAAPPATPSNR